VGKACDLIAWEGDPLTDITVLARENLRLAVRGEQVWVDQVGAGELSRA
jgi:imidazolonepropionase-like amidohydrolase